MSVLRSLVRDVLVPSIPVVALLAGWQAAVSFIHISPVLLPGPGDVWRAATDDAHELLVAGRSTLSEILLSSLAAIAIGYATAMALSLLPVFRRAVLPYMLMTQVVPKVALAPILIAWFGIGLQSRLLLAFLIAYFPMVITTLDALLNTDRAMVDYSRSLVASDWQILVKVRLPAALPATMGGIKITASLAVIGIVVGEFVASTSGLGKMVIEATALMHTSLMIAATLAIGLIGLILLGAIEVVERRIIRWGNDQ